MRFSEWVNLESFFDSLDHEMTKKKALIETISFFTSLAKRVFSEDVLPNPERDEELKKMIESLRIIRNHAIAARADKVNKIQELLDRAEKDSSGSSSDDFDSYDESDPMIEAVPILVDLGYVNPQTGPGKNISWKRRLQSNLEDLPESHRDYEKSREFLMGKMREAAAEKGNETLSMTMDVKKAREDLVQSVMKLYTLNFERMAARNRNQKIFRSGKIGHQTYEPNELLSEMILRIEKSISTRRWKKDELLPWDSGLKLDDILEARQKNWIHIFNHFASFIGGAAHNMRSKKAISGNPAFRSNKSENTNRDEKAKIIRADLESKNFDFYIDYLNDRSKFKLGSAIKTEKGKATNRLNPSFRTVTFTNSEGKTEEREAKLSKDDTIRLKIISAISSEYDTRPSSRSYLSISPKDIERTLYNYIEYFLRRRERGVTHASTLAGKDETSEDEILSNLYQQDSQDHQSVSSSPLDQDDPMEIDPMERGVRQSSGFNAERAIFDFFKPYMIQAINEIAVEEIGGANEALALCIKFDIPCLVTTKQSRGQNVPDKVVAQRSSVPNFSPEIREYLQNMISQRVRSGEWSWESFCKEAFNNYGKKNAQITIDWEKYPKAALPQEKLSTRGPTQINLYVYGSVKDNRVGGLAKLCRKMQELMPPWATQISRRP